MEAFKQRIALDARPPARPRPPTGSTLARQPHRDVVELSDSSDDDDGRGRARVPGRGKKGSSSSSDDDDEVQVVVDPRQLRATSRAPVAQPAFSSIFTQRPARPQPPSSSSSSTNSGARSLDASAQPLAASRLAPGMSRVKPPSGSSGGDRKPEGKGVYAPFKPPRFASPPLTVASSSSSSATSTPVSYAAKAASPPPEASLTPHNPFRVQRALDVRRSAAPPSRPAFLPSNMFTAPSSSSSSAARRNKESEEKPRGADSGEHFDLAHVPLSSGDYDRVSASEADAHMRELLEGVSNDFALGASGAGWEEGDEVVDGFRDGIRLMPHQILGTKWMRSRESGRKTGGILGDDMGLGKTVQSLVRIVTGPPRKSEVKAGWEGGTLIVCPLAVMSQWAQEIKNKTTRDLLSVCEHQGGGRTSLRATLLEYDVVITTYNVVQQEHGNHLAALAAAGRKGASGGRRGKGKGARGAGSDDESESDASDSASSDGGFGASLAGKKPPAKKPPARRRLPSSTAPTKQALFQVKWHRVILDEAQNIKNRASKTAKACIALESKYRWCLTGTPIQNNIDELYPLFAFLRIRPLNDWEYFKSTISKPVKEGRTKLAMKKLQLVLGSIMLRRLKTAEVNGQKILNLPQRTVTVVKCVFDADEAAFYKALAERTALRMSKFVAAGSVASNYTSILTMLLRLRQACDHPELVSQSFAADPDAIAPSVPEKGKAAAAEEDDKEADELADLLGGLSVSHHRPTCTVCSEPLPTAHDGRPVCSDKCAEVQAMAERAKDEIDGLPPTSAKTRKILQILEDVRVNSGGKEKTIIFSQFTKMLDKIEPFLKHARHNFVRYDGSLKNDDRTRVLDRFKTQAHTNVILISFKAGSTGLNLTAANHVILVDLWWNPALEEQAFDRAHRLGQTRDVEIYKLAIEETVEDKILALQEKKRELASAALSGTKLNTGKGGNRLGVDELMLLFKGIVSPEHDSENED